MRVVVLVPRRADHGRRDVLWAWVRDRWEREQPDLAIFEGHHDGGPFNRCAAINAASAKAGDWDVAIVADSDSFVGPAQIRGAIRAAHETGMITFAYTNFAYLSRKMSDWVMEGYAGCWDPGIEWSMQNTCSSMVVVPRRLWDEVGGYDEGFVGWGMEDIGFSIACQALGGGLKRVEGVVWHLHHQPSAENAPTPEYHANVARMKRYEACDYQPDKVRALLEELRA